MSAEKMSPSEMRILAGLAAMITTLAEVDGGWMPKSMLYIAMGSDFDASERAIAIAQKQGWVTSSSIVVTLTELGRRKADAISSAMVGA